MDASFRFDPLVEFVSGERWVGEQLTFNELRKKSPAAAKHGNTNFYSYRIDTAVRYGVTDDTEVALAVPYLWQDLEVTVIDEHHRNELLDGPGDARLSVKHFFLADEDWQFAGILGVSLPSGKINRLTRASYIEHGTAAAIGVTIPRHSHLQLGTGTFDPFVGLEALWRLDDVSFFYASAQANVPFYPNRHDYQTSVNGTLTAGPAVRIEDDLILGFLLSGSYSARDRLFADDLPSTRGAIDGEIHVPNTGRLEVSLQPSVTWSIAEDWTFTAQLTIPLYTRIRMNRRGSDVQLTEPAGVSVGVSYNF